MHGSAGAGARSLGRRSGKYFYAIFICKATHLRASVWSGHGGFAAVYCYTNSGWGAKLLAVYCYAISGWVCGLTKVGVQIVGCSCGVLLY